MSKSIFQSKTVWFNVGTALVAAAAGGLGYQFPTEVAFWIALVGNTILRYATSEPVHIISE